jgi:hypothetical protein
MAFFLMNSLKPWIAAVYPATTGDEPFTTEDLLPHEQPLDKIKKELVGALKINKIRDARERRAS